MSLGPKRLDQFPNLPLTGNEYVGLQYGEKTQSAQVMQIGDFLAASAPIAGAVEIAVEAAEAAATSAVNAAAAATTAANAAINGLKQSDGATKIGADGGITVQTALDIIASKSRYGTGTLTFSRPITTAAATLMYGQLLRSSIVVQNVSGNPDAILIGFGVAVDDYSTPGTFAVSVPVGSEYVYNGMLPVWAKLNTGTGSVAVQNINFLG